MNYATASKKSSNAYQHFLHISSGASCCICGKELTDTRDFCDPQPLVPLILRTMQENGEQPREVPDGSGPEEALFACRACFASVVIPARTSYITREREVIYNIQSKESSQDAYLLDEDIEHGVIRILRYHRMTHHTIEKFTLACTGEKIETRGKAARSAKIGTFSELECPKCRKQILNFLESKEIDLSDFY